MTDARTQILLEKSAGFGIPLDPAAAAALVSYIEALLRKNEEVNLTSVRDVDEAILRHVVDSLAFGLHVRSEPTPPSRILDFGTGGGFPGVPIAVAMPAAEVVLLDGTRKKLDAVGALCADEGIKNVSCTWARSEDLVRNRDRKLLGNCDAVVARAVGPLAELLERGGPFVKHRGVLVCWKSPTLGDDERVAGLAVARRAGFAPLADLAYTSDRPSLLVRYRRARG